ncbi:MAG: hypothetical protein NUW01_20370 [Gemmatimonadaceae bacterium]|nr:hypothetical protein [Gemmatimonadaceae bacterium]
MATFTVTLDTVNYLTAYAVDAVEIRWLKKDGTGPLALVPGRPGCTTLTPTPGQKVFTCQTDFTAADTGVQTFYAFVKAKLFGVTVPLLLEIGPNAVATVRVGTALASTFTALAAGTFHSCGLTSAGAAHCWGLNGEGQLGDGTRNPSTIPVAVQGGLVFTALTAGVVHSCGLTSAGAAHCWGRNDQGQLGDGTTTTPRLTPVAVQGGLVFTALTAGFIHTCGLTSAGAAHCWGNNDFGQVGDGTTIQRLTPVAVIRP